RLRGQVFGQVQREALGGDLVAFGVIARGVQGLVVDVGADRALSAQQQRGDGQDARAAAEIQHAFAAQLLAIQPLQAQRGGRVGAGAESQARVQLQVDRVRLRRRVP